MPFALVFTEQYNRRAARFLKRHPDLRQQYLKTLQLLEANPAHPSLSMRLPRMSWVRNDAKPRSPAPAVTATSSL